MNILILVSSLNYGGAEKQAVLDANMLCANNKVYIGMFEDGDLRKQLDPRVNVVQFKKQNYFSTASKVASFIKSNRIKVVHNHLYAPMIIASLASITAWVPVIWHFHGHHFEVRKPPLNILSKLPTVKGIVFVCSALAQYFEKNYWFPKDKIEVLYNSTQCKKNPAVKPNDNVVRIGFIGRVVALKRIQYLVNLAVNLKSKGFTNFEILVVGDGPEREKLEKEVQEKGVADKVKFLGFRSDIENFYNQFDVFVLPSQEEALSLALIDAGSVGLPAVAFDVGGNKEIVKNGETGFIVHSEEEMQEQTYKLCLDKDLRKRFGEKAEEHTRIFSEENHLKGLMQIYTKYAS